MPAKKKPSTKKKPDTEALPPVATESLANAAHIANHVHAGPACSGDTHDASCAGHPGPEVHCFEVHLPLGLTLCSCVHAVL